MALIQTWSDPTTGLTVPSAYHRVDGVLLDFANRRATWQVLMYRDQAARDTGLAPFGARAFGLEGGEFDTYFAAKVLDGPTDPQAQAYAAIKAGNLVSAGMQGQSLYVGAKDS